MENSLRQPVTNFTRVCLQTPLFSTFPHTNHANRDTSCFRNYGSLRLNLTLVAPLLLLLFPPRDSLVDVGGSFVLLASFYRVLWLFSTLLSPNRGYTYSKQLSATLYCICYSIVSFLHLSINHGFRGGVTRSTFARLGARPLECPIGHVPRGTHGRTKSFDWQGHV